MKLIVSDAGPLIALSRIGRLSLLPVLFGKVVVPNVVLEELRLGDVRPAVELLIEAVEQKKWLRAMASVGSRPIPALDRGESAAICLAEQLKCPLLVDERRGRIAARRRNVAVIGTGRLFLAAKEKGFIDAVGPILHDLRDIGYRLSDALCRQLLLLAEEASE